MTIEKFFGAAGRHALRSVFGPRHNFRSAFIATSAALLALTSVAPSAHAATITTLFSTGVDSSGNALPDGTVGDPHYVLFSVPGGTTDIRVRTGAGGFPIPPYAVGNSSSAWIGPNNDAQVDGPPGFYDYRTTFDLTGFNPSTVVVTGGWSSDNETVKILLNNVDTGIPGSSPNTQPFFSFPYATFIISSGFISGVNTLDFFVQNEDGPTALRVELAGTALATPLPAALPLFASGLGVLGLMSRRRKKKAAMAA